MTSNPLIYKKYPAFWFALAYITGLLAGWNLRMALNPDWLFILTFTLLITSILLYLFRKPLFFKAVISLVVLTGALHLNASLTVLPDNHLTNIIKDQPITKFSGVISESHYRIDDSCRYFMECDTFWIDSIAHAVTGKILLIDNHTKNKMVPGTALAVNGMPERPALPENPGGFNYRNYLQLNGIFFQYRMHQSASIRIEKAYRGYYLQRYLLQPVRDYLTDQINRRIRPPARDIIKALILGERQDLDRQVLEDFQKSGIIHVLAISGLHAGFILLIFLLIFSSLGLSWRTKVIAALVCLWIFVALVNFKAPVIRASFMATLYYASRFTERRAHPLNIMAVAAIVILLVNPAQILMPGFQFSFTAVMGIIYGYPALSRWLVRKKWSGRIGSWLHRWVRQPFLISAAAVLATAPLTWYHYGVLQTGALLINIIIIPLIFFYMALIFIFLFGLLIVFFPLEGTAWLLENSFDGIYTMIHWYSGLPFVQLNFGFPSALIVFLSFVMVLLVYHRRWLFLAGAMLLVCMIHTGIILSNDGQKLQITFVSVGQGDGAIIRFPGKEIMVVDGGDRNYFNDAGKRYMLPVLSYMNIRKIKYLIGTHGHSDHIGGLISIIESLPVDTLVLSPYVFRTDLHNRLIVAAEKNGVPVVTKQRGDRLPVSRKCRVYIMHPDKAHQRVIASSGSEVNNSSIVLKIVYGRTGFLLTGDLEKDAEPVLFNYGELLESDVLKAGHHGSITSSSQEFLDFIQPEIAVISVGRRNRFFHPSRRTVERLAQTGAMVFRTDRHGAVMVESDGKKVELVNWRKN
ncbi:MAG: DNA internalization-related competence protein ComEC/Rec2 [Calditrichaceae bacterium]|nr:DNA internalization-related competence protein ComEC/Rec2 [Calditrichaceae bacterium]